MSFVDELRELVNTVGDEYQTTLAAQHEADVQSEYERAKTICKERAMQGLTDAYVDFESFISDADAARIAQMLTENDGVTVLPPEYIPDRYRIQIQW